MRGWRLRGGGTFVPRSLRSEVAAAAAFLSGGVGRNGLNRPATKVQAVGLSEARARGLFSGG